MTVSEEPLDLVPPTTVEEFDNTAFLLGRDLRKAAQTLTNREARYLVDAYYQAQDKRIMLKHQANAAEEAQEPHSVIDWFHKSEQTVERSIKGALEVYVNSTPIGQWCLSIYGVGPIIAAGLLAHIDITRAPTVGHIWRFAGLDPTAKWLGRDNAAKLVQEVMGSARIVTDAHMSEFIARGSFKEETLRRFAKTDDDTITRISVTKALARQPWNAKLKRLCWIMGDVFVRLRGSEKDVYGKLYDARKAYELARNERREYAQLAATTLQERRIVDAKLLATYRDGRLPLGRIEQRSRRYAVKLFLSHFHHVAYELHYKQPPPKPYILDRDPDKHVHYLAPPNWPMPPQEKKDKKK